MQKVFRYIFYPPEFEDPKKMRVSRYLNAILNIAFVILLLLTLSGQYSPVVNLGYAVMILSIVAMHALMHSGRITLTLIIFSFSMWISLTYLAWVGDGIRDLALIVYMILIFLASLLGRRRLSLVLTILSVLSIWVLLLAQEIGVLSPISDSPTANAITLTSIFILFSAVLYFTISDLEKAFTESLNKEKALTVQNEELKQLQGDLEEKTVASEQAIEKAELQASHLQTIARVVQQVVLLQDVDRLLAETTRLVSRNFGYYHVCISRLSTDEKFLQLQAMNGQSIVEERAVEIANAGTVGTVATTLTPRIALDVGDDAVSFAHTDFPETRSQLTLPLLYAGELLGVLDIQTKVEAAFERADIDIFTTLSNQVASAIENARQFEQTQQALAEMEELSRRYVRQEWSRIQKAKSESGYRYVEGAVEKIEKEEVLSPAEKDGRIKSGSLINVPVKLRDETIGVLQVRLSENTTTNQEEHIELIETIADRVALALENARLLEDTAQQAGKESAISQFSTTISNISQTDKLMSVAVSELQKILQASEVSFELKDIE